MHFALSFSHFEPQNAQPPRIFIRPVRIIRGFSILSPDSRFLLNTERTGNTEFLSYATAKLGIPYTIRKKKLGIPTFSCIWTKMSATGGTRGFYFFEH
jgi:hypothetical protein